MKPKIYPIGKIYNSEANGWVYHRGGVSPTLCVGAHSGVQPKINDNMAKIYRIRKLTERECLRLMAVKDSDIDKIQNYPRVLNDSGEWVLPDGMTEQEAKKLNISASQMYKLAGNSIVVSVLEAIFTQLLRADSDSLF